MAGASQAGRASQAGQVTETGEAARASGAVRADKAADAGKASKTVATDRARTPRLPKDVATAIAAIQDKKAEHIVVLDLKKTGGFTDYFIICTGTNARQMTALADSVRDSLRQALNQKPALAEGIDRSEWILLDYFDFVVHIFSRECRAFYGLERLWGNAVRYEFPDEKV